MSNENIEIEKNKTEISNIISKVIDKGSNYIIKSMPVNDHIKEVLSDVKEAFKEKDFLNIIKVAVTSSINEGLTAFGIKKENLGQIDNMVDTALKGGLTTSINIGIGIVENAKKYGNIFYNYIEDFFESLKGFISSKDFKSKLYNGITKCLDKVDNFKEMCNDWYDAYDKFDLKVIKEIAGKLNKLKRNVYFDNNCMSENSIIQNVTELVSRKNGKLTHTQFDICKNLDKI